MAARLRYWDPTGERYGMPTWPYGMAPEGFATRRQLRALGLRPGGQPMAGQILWGSCRRSRRPRLRAAYLYRVDLAKPVRPMTPARWDAHRAAMTARRTCPACRNVRDYCIPLHLGTCVPCADGLSAAA